MLNLLKQCQDLVWSSVREVRNPRRRKAHKNYAPEALECRILPAIVAVTLTQPATLNDPAILSNMTIVGSRFADDVQFRQGGVGNQVFVDSRNGTRFSVNGTAAVTSFYFTPLDQVTLRLGAGSDNVMMWSTNLGDVVIEDGVTAAETNTFFVYTNGTDMAFGGVSAVIDQGNFNFGVQARAATITMGRWDFSLVRTARSEIGIGTVEQGVVDVDGDIRVNSMAATSVDVFGIGCDANPKRDQSNEGTIKVFGSLSVQLGEGIDTVDIRGAVEIIGAVDIDTGVGNDSVQVAAWSDGNVPHPGNMGPVFRRSVNILTGSGRDDVEIRSFVNRNRIQVFGTLKIDTGNDNDTVLTNFTEVRGALIIDAGLGGAGVNLESVEVYGTSIVTVRGDGQINLQGQGFFPTRFRQSAVFIVGAWVNLRIGNDDAASRIVFHKMFWVYGLYASRPAQVFFRGFVSLNPNVKFLTNADEY